jgi:multidrug efflux pump subunit AcrA (membrane-fusion protein)
MATKTVSKVIRAVVGVAAVGVALALAGWFYVSRSAAASRVLTASGTVEAVEVRLGTQLGGTVEAVNVAEGSPVKTGQLLARLHPSAGVEEENIRSPLNGVVLERLYEPGEIAMPGSTLLVLGDLFTLNLTVYVPEDRYGQIILGETYPVKVDSFPGRTFGGVVTYIADQAEFTPRNVQTVEGRKTTVFAIRLGIANPGMQLKPGMPADVNFGSK